MATRDFIYITAGKHCVFYAYATTWIDSVCTDCRELYMITHPLLADDRSHLSSVAAAEQKSSGNALNPGVQVTFAINPETREMHTVFTWAGADGYAACMETLSCMGLSPNPFDVWCNKMATRKPHNILNVVTLEIDPQENGRRMDYRSGIPLYMKEEQAAAVLRGFNQFILPDPTGENMPPPGILRSRSLMGSQHLLEVFLDADKN